MTPHPSFQGGQKGLKFEKTRFFNKINFWGENGELCPLFLLQIPKEEYLGVRFRKKKSWGLQVGKKVTVVLKIFFEKKRQFFFGHPKIWQLKTVTKHQISPKIFFIVPKSYFRSLKPFRTILGIKNLTRPIDQKFLKNHIFSH